MMTLYNLTGCPYCDMARRRLDELKLSYDVIEVPAMRPMRQEVHRVSGQWTVPVLVDDGEVFDDEDKIIAHVNKKYAT
ncbi:MAG: glutaredoxin [Candidatus Sericytochromatia bacterium]|nr:glutaredoxin [Candidatus Sericytochromatia bacterium]